MIWEHHEESIEEWEKEERRIRKRLIIWSTFTLFMVQIFVLTLIFFRGTVWAQVNGVVTIIGTIADIVVIIEYCQGRKK